MKVIEISSGSAWQGNEQKQNREPGRVRIAPRKYRPIRWLLCPTCQRKTGQVFSKEEGTLRCQACFTVVRGVLEDPALALLKHTE